MEQLRIGTMEEQMQRADTIDRIDRHLTRRGFPPTEYRQRLLLILFGYRVFGGVAGA